MASWTSIVDSLRFAAMASMIKSWLVNTWQKLCFPRKLIWRISCSVFYSPRVAVNFYHLIRPQFGCSTITRLLWGFFSASELSRLISWFHLDREMFSINVAFCGCRNGCHEKTWWVDEMPNVVNMAEGAYLIFSEAPPPSNPKRHPLPVTTNRFTRKLFTNLLIFITFLSQINK